MTQSQEEPNEKTVNIQMIGEHSVTTPAKMAVKFEICSLYSNHT